MRKLFLQSDRLFFILVLALAVFIPLYPKFPLVGIPKTFVSVRFEDFLILIVSCYWLWILIKRNKLGVWLKDNVLLSILLFWFIGFLSVISAVFLQTVTWHLAILHLFRRVELMILLPVTITAITSKRRLWTFLITMTGVVLVADVYALGQEYLGWPVVSTTNSEFSKGLILYLTPGARVNSTFAGHYDLAVFLVMFLSVLSAVVFAFKGVFNKVYLIFLGGLSTYILLLTAARQSFVAAILGIGFACWFSGKKIFIVVLLILAIGAVLYPSPLRDRLESTVVVTLGLDTDRYVSDIPEQNQRSIINIPTLQGPRIKEATDSSQSAQDQKVASDITPGEPTNQTELEVYRSIGIRLNIEWPRAIRSFLKNPFFGTGYSSVALATDNDVLRSLAEVGILGTLAFIMVIGVIVKRLVHIKNFNHDKKIRLLAVGILAMIFAFIVNSLFIDVFEASKIASLFWIIIGVGLAGGQLRNDEEQG